MKEETAGKLVGFGCTMAVLFATVMVCLVVWGAVELIQFIGRQ